jgi:hypothetical protein
MGVGYRVNWGCYNERFLQRGRRFRLIRDFPFQMEIRQNKLRTIDIPSSEKII